MSLTRKFVSNEKVVDQPVGVVARAVVAEPEAGDDAQVPVPEGEVVDAAWDVELGRFAERADGLQPDVGRRDVRLGGGKDEDLVQEAGLRVRVGEAAEVDRVERLQVKQRLLPFVLGADEGVTAVEGV